MIDVYFMKITDVLLTYFVINYIMQCMQCADHNDVQGTMIAMV